MTPETAAHSAAPQSGSLTAQTSVNPRARTDPGSYRFATLQRAGFTASASKQYYDAHGEGVDLTQDRVVDFRLRYIEPWSKSGTGDNVFDMPAIGRVKIAADYTHCCSNFIVHIAGDFVVNELIGTAYDSTHFEGTYTTRGGTVEILHSSGVRCV